MKIIIPCKSQKDFDILNPLFGDRAKVYIHETEKIHPEMGDAVLISNEWDWGETEKIVLPLLRCNQERLKKEFEKRKALNLIESFGNLPDNWDSFGGKAIAQIAITNATNFLLENKEFPKDISPTPDISILFTFENGKLVEFFSDGEIGVLEK